MAATEHPRVKYFTLPYNISISSVLLFCLSDTLNSKHIAIHIGAVKT